MIVSDRARCIFVHIQKTAGASIEAALQAHDPAAGSGLHAGRRHMLAREIRDVVPRDAWDAYFKFAFVRNPWDRLVSWYHMCMQVTEDNAFSRFVKQHAPTFEAFLTTAAAGPGARTTRDQVDYVSDEQGTVIVDFVGRYESVATDFAHVCRQLGVAAPLPHVNTSAHRDYREYYTAATREIVARRFARDIERFGYRF